MFGSIDTGLRALRKSAPEDALKPGLYLVATPIGNLGDITLRALDILRKADVIACEDTRVTAKLLQANGITAKTLPYHDHNADEMRPKLLAAMAAGQAVALVSDAGTPLVSDPGYKLARDAAAAGHHVTTAPGASAVLAALSLSGLPTDRFLFAGFLPPKAAARRAALLELAGLKATLVFFESPSRLVETLVAMSETLGDRNAAICRELTKMFEEARQGPLSALATHYGETPPRGEIVVVVGPPDENAAAAPQDIEGALQAAMQTLSLKEAVARVAADTGQPRKEIYARALTLTRQP